MLQDQVISVPFGGGISTKTDAKAVVQGKLIALQDGVMPVANQIAKRNGYSELLSFQSLLTRSFENQLLIGDGKQLYCYNSDSETTKVVGNYTSVSVNPINIPVESTVSAARQIRTISYTSATGNYACTVYVFTQLSTDYIYATVTDTTSRLVLATEVIASSPAPGTMFAQPFVVGGPSPYFGILYPNAAVSFELSLATITINSGVVTLAQRGQLDTSGQVVGFSALGTATASNYITYTVLTAGTTLTTKIGILSGNIFTSSVSLTAMTGGSVNCQTQCAFDTAGNIYALTAYSNSGVTAAQVYYGAVSSTLAILKNTTVITTYTPIDSYDPSTIALSPQSGGNMRAYYTRKVIIGTEGNGAAATGWFFQTYYHIVNITGAVGSNVLFLNNLEIESNFVTYGGINYAVFGNVLPSLAATFASGGYAASSTVPLSDENTYFLINETTTTAVAKCLSGDAIPIALDQYLAFVVESGTIAWARPNLNCLTTTGTSLYFGGSALLEDTSMVLEAGTSDSILVPLINTGGVLEQFNFSDLQAYQSVIFQNTVVFNGGIVKGYDGQTLTELGFLTFPDYFVGVPNAGSTGAMTAGTYGYAATYQWTDADNQSYESFPLTITVAGVQANGSVVLTVQTLGLTEKTNVWINIYRTDQAGQILYFLTRTNAASSGGGGSNPTLSIVDYYGPSLAGQPELYNTGGVVENDPPPPSMILTVRENRLYAVDSENPYTDYWYTKTQNKGFGIDFSAFFVNTIDAVGGPITSMAQMDEKLVTFKTTGLGFQTGDGPNDTGNNSTYTNFQFVPTDTSSDNHRATIVIPSGTVFQSSKGLYLLDRGLNVQYFAQDTYAYNNEFITAAVMEGTKNQVQFLTSTGNALVYNYLYGQWSTFTNHTGTSGDIFQNLFTYSRYDGFVYQENATTYLDNATAYSLTAQISWLKFGSIQGFQRVKQTLLLGDHDSPSAGHAVQMSFAYNFDQNGFNTPVPFTLTANSSTMPFQFREFLATQKCDSVSILIQEVTTGVAGEYVDFTDLSILAGVKKGLHKLPASSSVG